MRCGRRARRAPARDDDRRRHALAQRSARRPRHAHSRPHGLRQVIEHTPAELTVTLEAGLHATELADRLSAAGQWWPQADIRPGSTVGGILAAAASGRGRLRHGPVRDSLLEVVLVTGDGRIVKAGGRTVKGVAGYDIPRLAVGSQGTLGVITQVTLKLWPTPPARGWFAMEGSLDERLAARRAHPGRAVAAGGDPSDAGTPVGRPGGQHGRRDRTRR